MSVRTKEHPAEAVCTLAFVGPVNHAEAAPEALQALGFEEARGYCSLAGSFPGLVGCPIPWCYALLEHGQRKGSLRSSLPA